MRVAVIIPAPRLFDLNFDSVISFWQITIILVCSLLLTVSIAIYFAAKNSSGWRLWLLHVLNDGYCRWFLRWNSVNDCPFPQDGPALIISNHTSPTDPMLVWTGHNALWKKHHVRTISYLMAREYYETPGIVGWVSRTMCSIPVDRDGEDFTAVREALGRLRNGELVGVFPEGKINPHPAQLQPGVSGVAWLALRAKVPVYPVFIQNAPRGTTMVNTFFKRSNSTIIYGPAVDLTPWDGRKKRAEVLTEVTEHLMQSLATLGIECGMLDADLPQPAPASDTTKDQETTDSTQAANE